MVNSYCWSVSNDQLIEVYLYATNKTLQEMAFFRISLCSVYVHNLHIFDTVWLLK